VIDSKKIIARYSIFAMIATILNIGTQRIIFNFGNSTNLFLLALVCGTLIGLISKYELDRRWVFENMRMNKSSKHQFIAYALTGFITTIIFWTIEVIFWLLWQTDLMRELGAISGLAIGYIIKYKIDYRFVFHNKNTELN
jgi:putative flippase GtrA